MTEELPNEFCAKCRFWGILDTQYANFIDDQDGTCRRFPPTAILPDLRDEDGGVDSLSRAYTWFFPATRGGDWCGEFQSRDKKPAATEEKSDREYPTLASLPFYRRAEKALRHLVPLKTGVGWENCTIDMLSRFSFDDLREYSGCGCTTINEIRKHCHAYGITLQGDAPPLPDEQRPMRWLGRDLPASLLNRLEKHFLAAGKPGLPIICSLSEMLAVPPEVLSPPGLSGQWMADRFRQWVSDYQRSPLTLAEDS